MLVAFFLACQAQTAPPAPVSVIRLDGEWRFARDAENRGTERGYATPAFDDAAWSPIRADAPWEAQGHDNVDGFAWYRRAFEISVKPEGSALLELGQIDDVDEVFVNGARVGGTGSFPPATRSAWTQLRAYAVPVDALRQGRNTVAVRVFDEVGDGGLRGGPQRLSFGPGAGWLVKVLTRPPSGFAAANSGLAMELTPDGDFPGRIWFNPPVAGAWLEEVAAGGLAFREGAESVNASEALDGAAQRRWPFARAHYRSEKLPDLHFELEAFCPVVRVGKPYWTAIPVGFASIRVSNRGAAPREPEIVLRFSLDGASRNVVAEERGGVAYSGFDGEHFSMRSDARAASMTGDAVKEWSCRVKVPPGTVAEVRFCFARSPRGPLGSPDATAWPDSSELAAESLRRFAEVREATSAIDQWIPLTGDPVVDEALRWYCGAAVQLTKILVNGDVAVMGYAEMTQRDGFWASPLHNVLFPDLEKRMLDEIFEAQNAHGKVPTAILPTIDRGDDLDTNAYAMLRAFRYARWNMDVKYLPSIASNLKAAAAWLGSRDANGDGLPDGVSQWSDWKDVAGLAERQYSPHASFLYLAALRQLADAMKAGRAEPVTTAEIESRYARAKATVEKPVADGGLWNGRGYSERLKNGALTPQVNEDQVVGVFFGELTSERARLVFDALAANRKPWGFRESFPYRPAAFGYRPGDYANGAVWPWLNYVDAWARFGAGRAAEAAAILRDVARHDLLTHSRALPHECLDGETGEPLRNAPQAWNAAYFGAVFHGLFGVERNAAGELLVHPRAILGPGWRVRVPVVEGEVEVADAIDAGGPRVRWSLSSPLVVDVRVPGCAAFVRRLAPGTGVKVLEK